MATQKSYIEYIEAQLTGAQGVCRKMFGEYGVYCQGKLVALVCDNRFFIKPTPSVVSMLPHAPSESPYAGAKPMMAVTPDDADFLCRLVCLAAEELPAPVKKKKKS